MHTCGIHVHVHVNKLVAYKSVFSQQQGGVGGKGKEAGGEGDGKGDGAQAESHDEKPVKCPFDPSGYDKDLVEALERDIVQTNPNVHW